MIFGKQDNVSVVTLLPSEGPDELKKKLKDAVASFDDQNEILFLVDIWGGTPFNQVNTLFQENPNWAMVTGLNLPMLIEAYGERLSVESAHKVASVIVKLGRDAIKANPESIMKQLEQEKKQQSTQSNVGVAGKLEYVLARIDSRLLHGQVATGWTKAVNPTRIIVVSDSVSKDELRKNLIKQAAPPGVKAHVVPIDQMIKLSKDDKHFGGQRALLLFENPQDVLRAVEGGLPLKTVNVGAMSHSIGKVQPSKTLALDQQDVDTFIKLKELGIEFDVRKVPSDSKINMDEMLKKVREELKNIK